MCFKRALRILFCGLLGFIRALTLVVRLVFSKLRWRNTAQINMSDDECEFDSTWEDGDENKTPRKKMSHRRGRSRRNMFAARDMQDFRHSCRDLDNFQVEDDGEQAEDYFFNLAFYRGEITSSPDELYIKDFYKDWSGKYQWLEEVHSYIQWLFPIQEQGVNWRAHVLSKKEIMLFREDEEAKKKLVQSYRLMLDFYGISLVNDSTGEVKRAHNWKDRFKNLNRHTHNNLRITRILKCLGTLGLEHYQEPLVKFFLCETLVNGQLPNVKQSALDYFMFTVLDKSQRRELVKYAFKHFKPQEHFVWGPRNVLSGQMLHCKIQPTGSTSKSAEDPKNMKNVSKGMKSKEDHQNNDVTAIRNKLTETNSENEDVGKKKNVIACVSNGDEQDQLTQTNSENWANKDRQCSSKQMSHGDGGDDGHDGAGDDGDGGNDGHDGAGDDGDGDGGYDGHDGHDGAGDDGDGDGGNGDGEAGGNDENGVEKYEIYNKESEDNQKRLNTHDSKDQTEKMETSHSSEEVKSKTDQQNKNEPVIPSKRTEGNGVSDDSDNTAPENMCHGLDAASGRHQIEEGTLSQENNVEMNDEAENINANSDSHQTKDGALSQGTDVEIKEKPEDESEDNQKSLKPRESKDDTEKIETSNSLQEMKSKTDHQNKNELLIPNKVTEEKSVRVSDNIENAVSENMSHGHDAASGLRQIEEGTLSQENDVEMNEQTENIHANSDDEQ